MMGQFSFCRIILFSSLLVGCGSQSNLIGRTVPERHKENFFHSLDMAQSYYDQGRLIDARKFAQKAYSIDPGSEEAAVLLGFINLSLAGGDPFSLAKGLISAEKKRKENAATNQTSTGEPNTGDTLGSIKDAVGMSLSEIESLGTKDNSDIVYPVLLPKCAEEVRISVQRLVYVTEAIQVICPFVDEDARIELDSRHFCSLTRRHRHAANKAHFLWAFTHLTEAVAFNAVLNYKNNSVPDNKTNLEKRVEKVQLIDLSSSGNIDGFLSALGTIENTVNAIFPAGGVCSSSYPTSQLQATLNDVLAVDRAFSKIVGIPKGIATSIVKAVAKIKNVGEEDVGAKLAAIKGDFTKKMSAGISAKIDQLASDPSKPLDPAKKNEICSILASISSGSNTSEACK